MTDIKSEINGILNDVDIQQNRVREILLNKTILNDTDVIERIVTDINYVNSILYKMVDKYEKINTKLLSSIEKLNAETKEKQRLYKELKELYQRNKNVGLGIEVASEDSSKRYKSILKNIVLKNTVLIGLYYYIISV